MKTHRHAISTLALMIVIVAVMFGYRAIAQTVNQHHRNRATVSIAITVVPKVPPGENSVGEIRGTTRNAPTGSKVVIYSYGDFWYVQPYANAPYTSIGSNGKWHAMIHGGYEYAAFVVKPSYAPSSKTDSLPEVGGSILAAAPHAKPGG